MTYKRTTSEDPDFRSLVELLDMDLKIRDGDEHDFYAQFNKIDMIRNAIVGYSGNTPVGCGAFKEYAPDTVEIKRMYVLPGHRGLGIAAEILNELEQWAKEINYTTCVLETGEKQPEAIHLYLKCGYTRIPNYGQYANVANSVCMKKVIG